MATWKLILMVAALVQFALAAISVPSGRWNLIGGGLACWVGALVLPVD